jgi:hypothetical protein
MNRISKIFTLSLLGIFFLKYGIYASELSCELIKEDWFAIKAPPPVIKIAEKQELNVTHLDKSSSYTQESSELCKGKAFKEWVKKVDEEWIKKHDNYQDKLMVLTPFVVGEAMILKSIVNLSTPQAAASIIGGWLLADLVTGAVHGFFDNFPIKSKDYQSLSFLEERALTFQGHHYFPNKVAKSSYWFLTQDSYLLALPALAVGGVLSFYGYDTSACLVCITALLGAQAHYTHALSHGKSAVNFFVQFLQKTGIIISPKVHHVHHKDPEHAANYCIFNGHTNWVLDSFISAGSRSYQFFRKRVWHKGPTKESD